MLLTPELKDRFRKLTTAQVALFLPEKCLLSGIKALSDTFKMVGPAYTVRTLARNNCAVYYAIKHAPKGSVIVVDRGGDSVFACVGEVVALTAKHSGMEALVVDGFATDSAPIRLMDFPVFCTGLSSVTTNHTRGDCAVDLPISCGGAVVRPGDVIFGDADGAIVIPAEDVLQVLERAEQAAVDQKILKEQIKRTEAVNWDVDARFACGRNGV